MLSAQMAEQPMIVIENIKGIIGDEILRAYIRQ
jgi:hypothetical protein